MTPFEIASLHLMRLTFFAYCMQNMLILLTLFVMIFLAFYPNSRYAMRRRSRIRASELLFDAFKKYSNSAIKNTHIEFETTILSDEDKMVYDILRASKWTGQAISSSSSFEFKMSEHFYDVKHGLRLKKNKLQSKYKKLSKDLSKKPGF